MRERRLIVVSLTLVLAAVGAATAQGPEAPAITSWSNTKTGDQKTVFPVKPGENITFSIKAEGAEKFVWLVDGVIQEEAERDSFKWVVPNKRGMWKILVKATNSARREWARHEQEMLKAPKPKIIAPKWREKHIQDVTDLLLYPPKARREWIVAVGNPDEAAGGLKKKKGGKITAAGKVVGPATTTGWESEKAVAEGIQPRRGKGICDLRCAFAFDMTGDGKWTLICGENLGRFYGYYWDGKKWLPDRSRVKGLDDIGYGSAPALLQNLTGDKKWTLIAKNSKGNFFAWCWDGTKWVSDPARIKGLNVMAGPAAFTVLDNLIKGDSKWTLINGSNDGTFKGYHWDGSKWDSDPSRVAGLGDVGQRSRPTTGFDVFDDKKWTLITGNRGGTYDGYYWNGKKWIADPSRVKGIYQDHDRHGGNSSPSLAYNLRGDGRWVLIAGHGIHGVARGFFCNRVSKQDISTIRDATSISTGSTANIQWNYDRTWNHRVRYSTRKDMTDAAWSDLQRDTNSADVKLRHLKPQTTYYYQAFTYVPWDTDACATTAIGSFTTPPAPGYVRLKPGRSLQDAIDSITPEGGIIELLPGMHHVHKTIVVDRNNIAIQGTHDSEIRYHDVQVLFSVPRLKSNHWKNITFRGFKITTTSGTYRTTVIRAYSTHNVVIENLLIERGALFAAYSRDVMIRNNQIRNGYIGASHCINIGFIDNRILDAHQTFAGINANQKMKSVYIMRNYVKNAASGVMPYASQHQYVCDNVCENCKIGIYLRAHKQHVVIKNNIVTGSTNSGIQINPQGSMIDVIVENNFVYNNNSPGIFVTHFPHGVRPGDGVKREVIVRNNTIYNNTGDGIKVASEVVEADMRNNIITNNKGYGINRIKTHPNSTFGYNNVWNNTKGNYNGMTKPAGDISADPLFADSSKGDFHIRSKAGRWDSKAKKWVKDEVQSPCIDVGDPKADFSREPAPNGGRVNMGAYGNTSEASKTTVR